MTEPTITYHDECSLAVLVVQGGVDCPEGWEEIPVPWWTRVLGWIRRQPVTQVFVKGPARGH